VTLITNKRISQFHFAARKVNRVKKMVARNAAVFLQQIFAISR